MHECSFFAVLLFVLKRSLLALQWTIVVHVPNPLPSCALALKKPSACMSFQTTVSSAIVLLLVIPSRPHSVDHESRVG